MSKKNVPTWQVNPKSKATSPNVRDAYKARTLHLITITFPKYVGYSLSVNAESVDRDVAWLRSRSGSMQTALSVTAAPYPYELEVR